MTRTKLAASLLLALSCSFAAPLVAQQETAQQKFDRALDLRERGDLFEAMNLLQQVVEQQPTLGRARIELALTQARALRHAEARANAEKVLNDATTPETVKVTVRAFLSELEKEAQPHRFTPSIFIGLMRDDNVNVGPGSADTGIAGLTLNPGALPAKDDALTISAGLAHRYLSPNRFKFAGHDASFMWLSGISLNRVDYNSLDANDVDVATLRTGPFVVAGPWRFGLTGVGDQIWYGGSDLARFLSLSPSVGYTFGGGIKLDVAARVQDRDYSTAINDPRDSTYKDLAAGVHFPIIPGSLSANASVRLFDENAALARFSNDGTELAAGLVWQPWNGGTVSLSVNRRDYAHDDVEPIFAVKRDETQDRVSLEVSHKFSAGMLRDWIISGYAINTDAKSNVAIYRYDRSQVGLNIGRSF